MKHSIVIRRTAIFMHIRYKSLFLLVMLLAFTSQSLAANIMFCIDSSSGTQESSMSMQDHSGHTMVMNDDVSSDTASMDCCDTDCQCLIGGCSLYALVSSPLNDLPQINSFVQSINTLLLDRNIQSLYKPPIFR